MCGCPTLWPPDLSHSCSWKSKLPYSCVKMLLVTQCEKVKLRTQAHQYICRWLHQMSLLLVAWLAWGCLVGGCGVIKDMVTSCETCYYWLTCSPPLSVTLSLSLSLSLSQQFASPNDIYNHKNSQAMNGSYRNTCSNDFAHTGAFKIIVTNCMVLAIRYTNGMLFSTQPSFCSISFSHGCIKFFISSMFSVMPSPEMHYCLHLSKCWIHVSIYTLGCGAMAHIFMDLAGWWG